MLADQPPTVAISKPGRDTDATPVQKFLVEARADDDFSVRNLQLVYSVNGGPEKTIRLFSGAKPTPEVTAGHTFYLEELGVEPGDCRVVLRARHRQRRLAARSRRRATSISCASGRSARTSSRRPRWAAVAAVAAAAGAEVGALSQQQRQIIAGTFKVQRDRKTMGAAKAAKRWSCSRWRRASCAIRSNGLVERMNSRLVAPDPAFKKIAELLPKAAGR